ncbi:Calcineurin-like phosphoesterase superfamily domain-containing protein [Modicisalibacter muralis]|uniref:Calcineurin-like phosphoesterase superfamily domain-containing protein n=1 Tax=Modicisalibacter muralis TaxID=119000 RepID=A0A1G9PB25_9GAMM|nr:metallophosphoesterase [Halomonas muralis]SDL95924.1 Calcineurin-like phosphoesterase superfamily domain-containing protein [Halomonas muralis]
MRLRILSDLHLEHFEGERDLPDIGVDVVVLAGNIHRQAEGLAWAAERFSGTPTIYVAGNHEYYGSQITRLRSQLYEDAHRLNIHFLDNDTVTLGGVRFLGTTLWTDFALYADELEGVQLSHDLACRRMPDFRIIEHPEGETFTPQASQFLHRQARDWLEAELAKPHDGPTVVVSHHAPLAVCIPPRYRGNALSPAFASNLEDLMGQMALWIHGHVQETVDTNANGTRIIANPGGYPDEFEEPCFMADRVVEV